MNEFLRKILDHFGSENFLLADGFDDAIIGFDESNYRVIYSVSEVFRILEQDMTAAEAFEYYHFNMLGAYVGENTPIWCWDLAK